MRQKDKSK